MPKKKGSAKKKKGSTKKKSAKSDGPPPPPPGPSWPWGKGVSSWMGKSPEQRQRVRAVYREHYVRGEGIICTQEEWLTAVRCHRAPLASPESEVMVQMLVTVLANEGTRIDPPDNFPLMASAMRFRHHPSHFERMYQDMKRFFQQCDNSPSIQLLLDMYQPKNLVDGHLYSDKASALIMEMGITMGDDGKGGSGDSEIHVTWDVDLLHENIMEGFMAFVRSNELRLLDLFMSLDKDRSGSITREEFRHGLESMKIPVPPEAIDVLIDQLDLDGDGDIDYQEFAIGRDEFIEEQRSKASGVNVTEVLGEEAVEGKPPTMLTFDYAAFLDLVLHCHYANRP